MTYLLDVSVLIALLDRTHISHAVAHRWFDRHGASWASCPVTENGVIRIVGHPRYLNHVGPPSLVATSLKSLTALAGHEFWPDDISLLSSPLVRAAELSSSGRVTDSYLLALAVSKGGMFATLDRQVSPQAVNGGSKSLHIVEG